MGYALWVVRISAPLVLWLFPITDNP